MTREEQTCLEPAFAPEEPAVAGDGAADGEEVDLAVLFEQRNAMYDFLARLFRKEVDADLLDRMQDMMFPLHIGDDAADEGHMLLATYLSNIWEESLDELAVDYTRVFIGRGIDSYSAAYPFESTYTSPKRLKMQEARDEVLAIYKSFGYVKAGTWKDSEDHVAAELEFMRILGQRTITALNADGLAEAKHLVASQRNFLDDHLANWVPMMTADMQAFAHTKFYKGLALLTEGFLRIDEAFLADAAEALEGATD